MGVSLRVGVWGKVRGVEDVSTAWDHFVRSVGGFFSAVQSNAVLILVLVFVLVLVLLASRRYLIHSKLARRKTVELKPGEEFEVDLQKVLKIAKSWARVRPSGRRLINLGARPQAAQALRVSVVTDEEGMVRYRLTAPGESVGLLTGSGYEGVEARVLDSATGEDESVPRMSEWAAAVGRTPAAPSRSPKPAARRRRANAAEEASA